VREAHERRAVPAVQVVDRLASVRCCVRGVGCVGCWAAGLLGCLRVWRLPGLPAEASTGEATQNGRVAEWQTGRQADRRAVTSNFSGTGIGSCGTALHGPWVLGPSMGGRGLLLSRRAARPPAVLISRLSHGAWVATWKRSGGAWHRVPCRRCPPLPTAGPAGLLACWPAR
jgi:hypothetical protein